MTGPHDQELTLPVPPGSGWPGDPATPQTPVAADAGQVRDLAAEAGSLAELVARQSVCRACPRLVEWREHVAAVKRASSRTERYWGRPIPGWGDERPRVLILGLAPAANGGNRTGRVFTGDPRELRDQPRGTGVPLGHRGLILWRRAPDRGDHSGTN